MRSPTALQCPLLSCLHSGRAIALAAPHRMVSRADTRPGVEIETARTALAQVEALVPEQAQPR